MVEYMKSQQLEIKLGELIKDREEELGMKVIKVRKDSDANAHVLAKREFDNTHIVWSSYNTGEERTSYVGFYNGAYDMTLTQALDELNRRAVR